MEIRTKSRSIAVGLGKLVLMAGFFAMLMLLAPLAHAVDIRFSCSLWGCQAFQERAELWAHEHGHRVIPYEAGWMSDNLLGLYRQFLGTQSKEFDLLMIDTIWPGVLSKHLVDLRQYLPARSIEQHFKPIIDNLTDSEGRLIGMPLFTDAGLLYYRKDLLDKYGFAPPETWSELERIARTILEQEDDPQLAGFVWQGNGYEGLTCNALEWIDSYRGGTIIDEQGEITVDNARARRALAMARAWIGDISPPEVLSYTEIESARHFVTGHAIFMRNWMEYWNDVEAADSAVRGKVAMVPIPKGGADGKHSGTLGDMSLAVSRYSDHIPEAVQLLEYLTDQDAQQWYATAYSFSPTIIGLYDALARTPERTFMATFKDVLLDGVARPSTVTGMAYPKVSKKFYTAVHAILSGEAELDDALPVLEADLRLIRQRAHWGR